MKGFVLDKATILERLGGDEEIFAIMADMYLHDVDNYCREVGEALAAADARLLEREAHTIKGMLATFADDVGADMAAVVERQAKTGQLDNLAAAVAAVEDRLRLVADAVRAVVAVG